MTDTRPPAVAGKFYPAAAGTLRAEVDALLDHAAQRIASHEEETSIAGAIRAIIVPHAGYPHSGPIAAHAYARLTSPGEGLSSPPPNRIVILGPAHYAPVRGLAAPLAAAFATPLGDVPLDRQALNWLLQHPFVQEDDHAHAPEHGLEVQLPFLQTILDSFRLIPLIAGSCAPEHIAAALHPFTTAADLIVVSSDLSHFHDYEQARRLDYRSAHRIEALKPLAAADACGRVPINGLLHLARQLGWQARTLDLRSSGDTGGPRHRVVGYGAFIFEGPPRVPRSRAVT